VGLPVHDQYAAATLSHYIPTNAEDIGTGGAGGDGFDFGCRTPIGAIRTRTRRPQRSRTPRYISTQGPTSLARGGPVFSSRRALRFRRHVTHTGVTAEGDPDSPNYAARPRHQFGRSPSSKISIYGYDLASLFPPNEFFLLPRLACHGFSRLFTAAVVAPGSVCRALGSILISVVILGFPHHRFPRRLSTPCPDTITASSRPSATPPVLILPHSSSDPSYNSPASLAPNRQRFRQHSLARFVFHTPAVPHPVQSYLGWL